MEWKGWSFPCNGRRTFNASITQVFEGIVKSGQVKELTASQPLTKSGGNCLNYTPDILVHLEIWDGKLLMYRADGTNPGGTVVFEKKQEN